MDHNVPRSLWINATVTGIIDHHDDRGLFPDAKPRVIKRSASCSTLVVDLILGQSKVREQALADYPRELIELLMKTSKQRIKSLRRIRLPC